MINKPDQDCFRLAIVGDLHTHWDNVDLAHFANSDYDLLFFTGDLGGGTADSSLRIARSLAPLSQPTLIMPGNNDTFDIDLLAAELAHQQGAHQILSLARSVDAGGGPMVRLCGYSHHAVHIAERSVSLIAARPHSMGGPELSFPDFMRDTYGVASLEDSTARLIALVDSAECDEIVFLAHNGPHGLGDDAHAMWGCDFKQPGGDWGDPDLREAVAYARACNKKVLAVVAGHMHLRTKQGMERPWLRRVEDVLYVNAARVPRIFNTSDDVFRHHLSLVIDRGGIRVDEVLVPQYSA